MVAVDQLCNGAINVIIVHNPPLEQVSFKMGHGELGIT